MTLLDKEQMVSHRRSTTFSNVEKTSLRKPRFRISFQICSIGFISGVYGGMWKRIMFSGNSKSPDLCHAAPSQQSSIMSSEYCSDNLFRKIFMHTVLQSGMTRKYPSTALPPHRHSDTPGCGDRVHWDVSLSDTSSTWAY